MTCREKLMIEHPERIDPLQAGGCEGCPKHYGYLPDPIYCSDKSPCVFCWDREIPEKSDGWIRVKDRPPELPDRNFCDVIVITCRKGDKRSRAMIYERTLARGKTVERWKNQWGTIADEVPDYWMPLPEPVKEEL